MQQLKQKYRVIHHIFGVGTVKKHNSEMHYGATLVLFDKAPCYGTSNTALWNCVGYAPNNNGRFFFDTACSGMYCCNLSCLKDITDIYDELKNSLIT